MTFAQPKATPCDPAQTCNCTSTCSGYRSRSECPPLIVLAVREASAALFNPFLYNLSTPAN